MKAHLLPDIEVEIDPRSLEIGGSWEGPIVDGFPTAWGGEELVVFYNRLRQIKNPVFLDIGANTGSYCLFCKAVEGAKAIAFEPNPVACEILRVNIALNELEERIVVSECALSNKNGQAVLKIPAKGNKSGLSCIGTPKRFRQWTETTVAQRTLDGEIAWTLSRLGAERVHLAKLDTEGAELLVLSGGIQVLKNWHPELLLEFYEPNMAQFGYRPGAIIDVLHSCGYTAFTKIGPHDLWAKKAR